MLTFGAYQTKREWMWEPLRRMIFNTAPPLTKPAGGVGHLVGPVFVSANKELELFSVKCASFWAQFAIDYLDGRNSDILTALIQTDGDVHGSLTHEISQSVEDIDYTGYVDQEGIVHVSATTTADATVRGNVIYVPV